MTSIHRAVKIKNSRTFKELIQNSELCRSRNRITGITGLQLKQDFKTKGTKNSDKNCSTKCIFQGLMLKIQELSKYFQGPHLISSIFKGLEFSIL